MVVSYDVHSKVAPRPSARADDIATVSTAADIARTLPADAIVTFEGQWKLRHGSEPPHMQMLVDARATLAVGRRVVWFTLHEHHACGQIPLVIRVRWVQQRVPKRIPREIVVGQKVAAVPTHLLA